MQFKRPWPKLVPSSICKNSDQPHGPDAVFHASQRADELLERGDMDGRHVWQLIHAAMQDLLRERPAVGETVQ